MVLRWVLGACLALSVPALSGCMGDECGGQYWPDETMSAREKELAEEARVRVNTWVGGEEITFQSDAQCRVQTRDLPPMPDGSDKFGYRSNGNGVYVDRDAIAKHYPKTEDFEHVFRATLMHEMMHAIGFHHHDGPGVMAEGIYPTTEFTDKDRR